MTYDLLVLGGGTGGLVSAMIAAGAGARVALVERDRTGGDCLWTGCVPSKSLLAAAGLAHAMRHADRVGLPPATPTVDLAAVLDHVRAAQATIAPHDSVERLTAAGVDVLVGEGRFTGPRTLTVDGRPVRFRRAIVATGSRAVVPPVPGLAALAPLTHETVWELRALPARLAVLGAGPIGCELGQALGRLGSRVTLLESGDRPLRGEEPEASALLAEQLREDGIDLRLGVRVTAAARGADGAIRLTLGDAQELVADAVLVAAGRAPRSDGIGLDAAGVRCDAGGAIVVDPTMRTSAAGIFAVGDVVGAPAFTHVAAHHARQAAVNALFGLRRRADRTPLPWVTFTDPEVAHVGLTVAQARERHGERVVVARSTYAGLDRAIAAGEHRGGAILVGDARGRLVGATLVGRGAGESIAELTAWIATGAKLARVSGTVHAYPTYAGAAVRAVDDHLRKRYAGPGLRRALAPVLAARRLVR
ncbi:dihydrolipoyl dehydrogenase family protein [Paraconexibacter algicola]|uniref:Oxidoreductase n=1 Tax=Paraconexibacter algicola TaxID=2133960 RepID=A0A2T4UI86_9ACTN|nr:FAD-dependent oxidoreductase [Paraconexibacter algicola]PTL58915.1 oxidoreductase [Paraconexibacter algicola]